MHLSLLFRRTAVALLFLLSFHTFIAPVAGAVMIETESMAATEAAAASRAELGALLAREDVAAALLEHGVTAAEALTRINSLTDQEVVKLAQNIDSLPAAGDGAGGLIGAIVFIFLVLLFTDIIGVTDVFPFVKKHR